jgi:hypothetical protein
MEEETKLMNKNMNSLFTTELNEEEQEVDPINHMTSICAGSNCSESKQIHRKIDKVIDHTKFDKLYQF